MRYGIEWANGHLQVAVKYAYRNADRKDMIDGTDRLLPVLWAVPTFREQMAFAADRLAST